MEFRSREKKKRNLNPLRLRSSFFLRSIPVYLFSFDSTALHFEFIFHVFLLASPLFVLRYSTFPSGIVNKFDKQKAIDLCFHFTSIPIPFSNNPVFFDTLLYDHATWINIF